MTIKIDINADVGEGLGNEADLLPLVTSCNIACGGHAGDMDSIRETIRIAQRHAVKIGAHPGYPDKENFGRKVLDIPDTILQQSIREQLGNFHTIVNEEKGQWHHIKPHGALYNSMVHDPGIAMAFLEAAGEYLQDRYLYAPFQSEAAKIARNSGISVQFEAFGDRNYNPDLSLVSRRSDRAVITTPQAVLEHVVRMVQQEKVKTVNGEILDIKADTFCIHGDTPDALEILAYLHKELPKHNIQIAK